MIEMSIIEETSIYGFFISEIRQLVNRIGSSSQNMSDIPAIIGLYKICMKSNNKEIQEICMNLIERNKELLKYI
jgi:hypothetical protein